MYGIIYCSQEEAYEKFEEIKRVLEKDYEETLKKCQVVTEKDYKRQSMVDRITGKVLRIFAPLM